MNAPIVETAVVASNGQITIPQDVREHLGVGGGDQLTFIATDEGVRVVNSAVYALRVLQDNLAGVGAATGLDSDEAIDALIADLRN